MKIEIILLSILLLVGCNVPIPANQEKYTIEVYANPGLEFQGSIGGSGNTRSIQGIGQGQTPLIYEVVGFPAIAVIQKMQESGTVIVKIKDSKGNLLQQQSTDGDYGIVTVHN